MKNDATIKTTAVKGHEPSLLPAGKDWKLIWNDEFDGTELDRSKWTFRTHFWGRRFPAFADNEGVVLDGKGNVELHLVKHGERLITSGNIYGGYGPDYVRVFDCVR
jgi:hypothetical protein